MSDFFRVAMKAELVRLTVSQLAAEAHRAEDTGDDVLLMQVWAELEQREADCPHLSPTERFRAAYIEQHRTRRKKA